MKALLGTITVVVAAIAGPVPAGAHDGPPYPILSDHRAGPYVVSVWTDPDTTDDGSPGGQFWIMFERQSEGAPPVRIRVAASPLDRPGTERSSPARPVAGQPFTHFAAVVLDHEGRFKVRVDVDGPLGGATLESEVEATYDLRPSPIMLALYLVPFVLVAGLWIRLLLRRRATATPAGAAGLHGRGGSP